MYHMKYLAQNGSRRPKSPSFIAGNDIWYTPSNFAQYFDINDHKHIISIGFIDFQLCSILQVVGTGHHSVSSRAYLYWSLEAYYCFYSISYPGWHPSPENIFPPYPGRLVKNWPLHHFLRQAIWSWSVTGITNITFNSFSSVIVAVKCISNTEVV